MNIQQNPAYTQLCMEWLTNRRAFRTTLCKSEKDLNQYKVFKEIMCESSSYI